MDAIPTGSILLLLTIDLALVLAMSAAFGVVVAARTGRPLWLGAGLGVALPLIGPLGWSMAESLRDHDLARVRLVPERPVTSWVLAGASVVSAVLFLLAAPLPWSSVSGSFRDYSLATAASPADSGFGLLLTVGSTVVMVAVAVGGLTLSARVRLAMVGGLVAGAWLLVTLDSLIVLGALEGVSETARGLSGGAADVTAEPGAALWLCLVAAVLALGVAVRLVVPASPGAARAVLATEPGAPVASRRPSPVLAADAWGAPPSALGPARGPVAKDDGWGADDGWGR